LKESRIIIAHQFKGSIDENIVNSVAALLVVLIIILDSGNYHAILPRGGP
jgi:hypothetical protein